MTEYRNNLCCLHCRLCDDLPPSVASVFRVGSQVESHSPKLGNSEGEWLPHLSKGVDTVVQQVYCTQRMLFLHHRQTVLTKESLSCFSKIKRSEVNEGLRVEGARHITEAVTASKRRGWFPERKA